MSIAEYETWFGPFPMLATWDRGDPVEDGDHCVVACGAAYRGPGLYAVRFANGTEAVCRLERRLDQSRRWRVLPQGCDVKEIEEGALRILGRVEWVWKPAPNFREDRGALSDAN